MQSDYLKSGGQTEITSEIQKLADELLSPDELGTVFNILKWISRNIEYKQNTEVFRTRTSDQILSDKYATGCTDYSLLFIAIARAAKFPTKYVEMLSKKWIENGGEMIEGHVICELKIGDEWLFVDPTMGSISIKPTSGMIVYGKGLDSWDLELRNRKELEERFDEFRVKFTG